MFYISHGVLIAFQCPCYCVALYCSVAEVCYITLICFYCAAISCVEEESHSLS